MLNLCWNCVNIVHEGFVRLLPIHGQCKLKLNMWNWGCGAAQWHWALFPFFILSVCCYKFSIPARKSLNCPSSGALWEELHFFVVLRLCPRGAGNALSGRERPFDAVDGGLVGRLRWAEKKKRRRNRDGRWQKVCRVAKKLFAAGACFVALCFQGRHAISESANGGLFSCRDSRQKLSLRLTRQQLGNPPWLESQVYCVSS